MRSSTNDDRQAHDAAALDIRRTYFSSAAVDFARARSAEEALPLLREWLMRSHELAADRAREVLNDFDRKRSYREVVVPGVGHVVFKMRPNSPPHVGMTVCRVYCVNFNGTAQQSSINSETDIVHE